MCMHVHNEPSVAVLALGRFSQDIPSKIYKKAHVE